MAPIQSKPELSDSPAGATSQSPGSATASAVDENKDDAQQPSLDSTRVTSSPPQSIPLRLQPILRLRPPGLSLGAVDHQDASYSSGPTAQKTNTKRKADHEAASRPSKAARPKYTGTARAPRDISPGLPGGNDPTGPPEAPQQSQRGPSQRPLCTLREIIDAMIRIATSIGLSHFLLNGRPYYIRVGTVCSGTDAPIHVMEMFSMFKDEEGNPVFHVSNEFACEIEWWKQSFLKRNSKPKLLFKDARDFAQGDSEKAHLVTGAEADIPPVDFFIAGTSCVDFSTLNTNKTREFAGLKKALDKWKKLKEIHGDDLSYEHLSPDDWRSAMDAMNAETEKKNQSEQTFSGAINYIKCRQPKVVICENVDSAPWQKLVDNGIFQLMGYSATVLRLDTKQFYMPQTRVRKYLILFSHRAFTLAGAQALSKMFKEILPQFEHNHSNSVLDFLFPLNSHELQKARNEVESDAQGSRERETSWSISRDRHEAYRRKHTIPDIHPWMQWFLNAHANSPANMWKPWANRMPLRVLDVLDCLFLYALYGRSVFGPYDMRYKGQIIDCSQNVDRISPDIKFGRTGCLTPNAIPVLTLEARPIIGAESLRLQGLPVENFDMSVETQAQLQDLAGNAMTTTVVGAVILATLTAIARVGKEEGYNWLQQIFYQSNLTPLPKILNSFHHADAKVDRGPQIPLHLKLYAHSVSASTESHPHSAVQDILELGKRARRRCPCHHILSYSSVELYVCTVCGVSHCKSCKGNPEHNFVRSEQSLEDLDSLPYAQAEYEFRKRFPAMLWMQSSTATLVEKLDDALVSSTCHDSQRDELSKAIIDGLCNSTYQLQLVEIADAVRLAYVAGSTSRLRVVVEENEVTWSLHLDQYCHTSDILSSVLPKGEPIARAVLGREEKDLFPDSHAWEFWIPQHASFALEFQVQDDQALALKIGDLDNVPEDTRELIAGLEGSLWKFHPECGFPEYALWVHQAAHRKYFLFKDIDPIGAADQDAFVITPVSREMGRTAPLETRPVLLRISKEHQIHRSIKDVLLDHGPFLVGAGHRIPVQGSVGGWWRHFNEHAIDFSRFPNMEYDGVKTIAKAAPTCIRQPGDPSQARRYEASCDELQSLLTISLPILGNDEEAEKIEETLGTLDLTKPLDVAELNKLTGPLYSAVELGLVGVGKRVVLIQGNVELKSDCHSCAPKIPEVFYVKSTTDKAGASRATGPVVARHRGTDQQKYELNLQSKPRLLHIDHNVTSQSPYNELQLKKDDFHYVDICFLAHGHALLHQARAHLPQHPSHFEDTTCTRGTFAMEVAIIENPRIILTPPTISAPNPVLLEDARLPSGFQYGMQLFKEQSDSLQWMLSREPVHDPEPFMEVETAEVHQEQYRMRFHADAKRPVYRRGRVVADNVGFGKTAVCLGLIDVQRDTDRNEFMAMRQTNKHLQGLVHLHATLIIVPNQLTHQWQNEAKRFLGLTEYKIIVIPTFNELQKLSITRLKKADIVICSNKVFLDNKYYLELSRYCSPNDVDKVQTMQKVYRAWYKQFQRTFEKVRDDVIKILEQGNRVVKAQQMAHLRDKLDQIRADLEEVDGEEQLAFAPADNKTMQSRGKKGGEWFPQLLFEMLSWSRIIWDEFPYENIPVTEFVANCATTSKWMLSGTPPLNTLGDVCKVAYLFNVHVARPLQLIKGRQPTICENEPLAPHSDLESTGLFQSRPSLKTLQERHLQLKNFVSFFMRKNRRDTEVVKIELPIVLTMSPMARLAYAELQVELQSRQYNANNVGTECRRRLMGHIDWRGKESGRDRSVEALTVRASASIDDVLEQSGLVGLPDIEAARKLLSNTHEEIHGIEDRGRELLGKAIFLAYRLTFITLSNAKEGVDGQDERHLDYYQSLVEIVESVLNMDMKVFQSWDAFNSAMRILIWPEEMRNSLGNYKPYPQYLPPMLRTVFDRMEVCKPPAREPKGKAPEARNQKARENFEAKKRYFETFRDLMTKTPLHSRRWFLVDKVDHFDAVEEELLQWEWSSKMIWEKDHDDSERGHSGFVLPHKLTEPPSLAPNTDAFDLEDLKSLDRSRRDRISLDVEAEDKDVQDAMKLITIRKDYKDSKAFWEEECNRRGLVAKSIDKKEVLKARVAGDIAKTATDKDYISPESCGVTLVDFPQEGKRKIRGGFMEVIFDSLMQALDGLTSVLERSVVIHARRNLQEVVVDVLGGTWKCHNAQCGNDLNAHYVSLICGHVFCGKPDNSKPCGVGLCQRSVQNVCIPLSEIRNSERVIAASSLSGAITSDPDPYMESEPDYEVSTKGPKARAIINIIRRIGKNDQVVIFVQTATMKTEIYRELAAAKIKHVTALMLSKHEAGSLEDFKNGKYKVLVQTVNSEQAAGSNLHNANHVIFVSPLVSRQQAEWDAQMRQALGRCVRFRQSKKVYVYHMLMDETAEVDTLEWRMKKEVIVADGQAVGRFNDCATKDFLARYEGDETATAIQMAPEEGRVHSILPRDDVQYLMGDDILSLAAIKALRTIDESMADKVVGEEEEADTIDLEVYTEPSYLHSQPHAVIWRDRGLHVAVTTEALEEQDVAVDQADDGQDVAMAEAPIEWDNDIYDSDA